MVQTQTKRTENIGEEVGLEMGAKFILAYRQAHPTDALAYVVGRNILDQVLAQPGCAGIKFYNAYNETGQKTLVYVGINSEGADMLNITTINTNGELEAKKGIVADRSLPPVDTEITWWES